MLSAIPDPQAIPSNEATPLALSKPGSASPSGFTPTQIADAYGINNIKFNGINGTGAGQTIAIIGAYDNPMLLDSTDANFNSSDLHKFDQAMGLSDPPSFIKVDQNGGTSYPATNAYWANESALDVEWSHALAPQANILLIECSSTNLSNLIEGGAQYATDTAGVSVVTMSFNVSEFMGETSYDSFLESPTDRGVTFVAASGDQGSPGSYPAYSPNVVAVGGTTLTLSGNSYSSETGWDSNDGNVNSSGGGISSYESKPSYQFSVTQSTSLRTNPDVAFDGNPNTGVPVYDSFNGGDSTPWYKEAGTSFSSPAFAALIAIADQGRAQIGLGSLDGPSQTLPRLYSLGSSDFHDITSGNNGYAAGTGYDLVSGLGSPIADKLVPDLAGGNSVTGTVFVDSNGNGTQDAGETGLAGTSVFLDVYNTGIFEGADQEITSTANGTYDLADLPGGSYHIAASTPAGFKLTTATGLTESGTFDSTTTGKNFGFKATATPAKLAFTQQDSSVTAGVVLNPAVVVQIEDSNGNLVASDNSAVTISLASGSAALGGTLTVNAVNGVATFSNLTLSIPGTDTLTATDGSFTAATSSTIKVLGNSVAPAGSVLVFAQQPVNTSTGAVITPSISVDVENSSGGIITTDGSPVTLAIATGSGNLGGTLTVNTVAGVATFSDITLDQAGTYTLSASDGSLTPITSNPFIISGIPVQVAFAQQPTTVNSGAVISPAITVDVEDGTGTLVATDNSPVTLSVASGTGTLGGTLTVNAVNGVATFSDITVLTPGTFTLNASDGSLTTATSGQFAVNVPGTLVPALVHNTLTGSYVAGAKTHANVLVDVSNVATNTSTGTVTTNVFATIDGAQTLLATTSRKMSLKAKKGFTVSLPIKELPASLTGTYTLQVEVVDTAGLNQQIDGPTFTVAQPFVSLTEAVTKMTLPSAVIGGATTRSVAVVKVTNTGNVPSTGVTTTRIYLSPDGTINSGELIGAVTRPMTIKANGSVLVTVPLTLIPAALKGALDVLAEVTDPNAIRTFVNTGSQVTVGAPFVSLSATFGAPAPATAAPGKFATVTVTLANAGNVASTGIATINLGLTADKVSELPGSVTTTRSVTIAAGKSVVLRLKIAIPATLTAGAYFPYLSFSQGGTSFTSVGTSAVTVS